MAFMTPICGTAIAAWDTDRPRWFPPEFSWVVGCSHSGIPDHPSRVRNFIGCNMSFRRSVWEQVGGFYEGLGRVGSNAFGYEEVDGVRQHGIAHYLELVRDGRIDLAGMLTHTFALDAWRDAFSALATQDESGAIKVAFDMRGQS